MLYCKAHFSTSVMEGAFSEYCLTSHVARRECLLLSAAFDCLRKAHAHPFIRSFISVDFAHPFICSSISVDFVHHFMYLSGDVTAFLSTRLGVTCGFMRPTWRFSTLDFVTVCETGSPGNATNSTVCSVLIVLRLLCVGSRFL